MAYELRRQSNGSMAVYHRELGETMHPAGPWVEATQLYVGGTGLDALLGARQPGGVCAFDVGLGAAANAIAALECHRARRASGKPCRPLHVVSFEHDLGALELGLSDPEALAYLRGYETAARSLIEQGRVEPLPGVVWELRLGDFTRLLDEEPQRADVVFFDPFSARATPEPWSLPVLNALYACRRPGREMVVSTYSSAFGVRAGFLLAGFYVGEGPSVMPVRHTTIAATHPSLLDQPVGAAWLARWRQDRQPWPPLSPPEQHRALREALLAHPQFERLEPEAPPPPKPARRPAPGRHPVHRPLRPEEAGAPVKESRRAAARRRDAERAQASGGTAPPPRDPTPRRDREAEQGGKSGGTPRGKSQRAAPRRGPNRRFRGQR